MKKRRNVIRATVVAGMMGALICCAQPEEAAENIELQEVTRLLPQNAEKIQYSTKQSYQVVQDFAMSLFREKMNTPNVVLSPVSAYIALSMVGAGAEGATAEQFERIMGKQQDMLALSAKMTWELEREESQFVMALANSAWLDDEFTVNEEWTNKISGLQNIEAFQMDVSSQKAMSAMNQWIEEKTGGMIQQMLSQPMAANTRLVLFNTLYFHGEWRMKFMPQLTTQKTFYVSESENIQVPMMLQNTKNIMYMRNEELEGVLLPYQNDNAAFVAIRATKGDIRAILADLSFSELNHLINDAEYVSMNLELPKFEVTFDEELNDSLVQMGLTNVFNEERAELSGLGTSAYGYNLYVDTVRQKAVVKVDEDGTEAAIATEVAVADTTALIENPVEVIFDEPFFYMVIDMHSSLPLFIGIMDNPLVVE